ncbi:uncharacterized protein EDB91DRAFT_210814 [Suillus paluster]|uniref:uncharacterized protein n=1 Tax=Suillus paluster TaxID=48578 RepID=UPI001B873363|nr:uncharacterized protein EDB91DRAFT_210814 [Suillus paluster]KAG1744118.1 hypothetical protein EDB91DRAFT_210814 [Suillus paluster]
MVLEMLSSVSAEILGIDGHFLRKGPAGPALTTSCQNPLVALGTQHTCLFPHHKSHRISEFGSRSAYALPRYRTPTPRHGLEALSTDGRFRYAHIWDFNRQAVARSKNTHDPASPDYIRRFSLGISSRIVLTLLPSATSLFRRVAFAGCSWTRISLLWYGCEMTARLIFGSFPLSWQPMARTRTSSS